MAVDELWIAFSPLVAQLSDQWLDVLLAVGPAFCCCASAWPRAVKDID